MRTPAAASNGHVGSGIRRRDREGASRGPRRGPAWVECAALIVIAVLLIGGVMLTSNPPDVHTSVLRISVGSGDTLWSIAKRHPVRGLTTSQTADLIARTNGTRVGRLEPGSSVLVPVEAPRSLAVACR